MWFDKFRETWDSTRRENGFYRWLIGGLVATNLLTAFAALQTEQRIILSPMALNERVEILRNRASAQYKQAVGLSTALLLGNVTPGNVDFIKESLEPLLAAAIYRPVMEALSDQIRAIKLDNISIAFEPKEVLYERETDKVFVTGQLTTQGPSSKPDIKTRTYELRIAIDDYRPRIAHIAVYAGAARTQAALKARGGSA